MRAILLGYGNIGRHHLRILQGRPDVELCGVIDISMPALTGVAVYSDLDHYLQQNQDSPLPQVAIVATPLSTHFELGMRLLHLGLHVFIEKPLAPAYEQALQLCETAHQKQLVLAVGHSERFNPAFEVFYNNSARASQAKCIVLNATAPAPSPNVWAMPGPLLTWRCTT